MNKPGPARLDGQRTLAAIVFTDVVGYSARMGADEEGTLRLFKDDSVQIQAICEKHEGEIRKFTGDGMLMYFHSAVQAVACALEVQRLQAEKARTLPSEQVLQHRIGIHLGDVFVTEGDVMGDGVNIAARLQAEAEPGGICVSQTVYDVVKNKIALRATYLGPRDLKNIAESVGVYKILLAAQEGDAAILVGQRSGANATVRLAAAAVAAVLLGVGAWWILRPTAEPVVLEPVEVAEAEVKLEVAVIEPEPVPPKAEPAPPEPKPEPVVAPAPAIATPAPAPAPRPAPEVDRAAAERAALIAEMRARQIAGTPQPSASAAAPNTPSPAPSGPAIDPATGEAKRMPDGRLVDMVVLRDELIPVPRSFLTGRTRPEDASVAVALRQRGFTIYGSGREHLQRLSSTEGLGLASSWFKSTLAEFDRERALRVNLLLDDGWFPVELWADRNANISVRSIYGIEEFQYEEIAPVYLGQLLLAVAERRAAEGVRLSERIINGMRDFGRTFNLPEITDRALALR
jgi:class 3 adenylate cyclase